VTTGLGDAEPQATSSTAPTEATTRLRARARQNRFSACIAAYEYAPPAIPVTRGTKRTPPAY